MTSLAEPEVAERIRTIVFKPSERKDCIAVARASFEDYLRMDVEGLSEWVDGEVRLYMSVSLEHQRVVDFLNRLLGLFVEMRGIGAAHTAPYAIRSTPGGSGREPDLLFVATRHFDRLGSTHLVGPPDLAVEVVSPDSVERDYVEKFREYEAAGVAEYWVIDARPGKERADFFVLRDGHYDPVHPVDGIYRSTVVEGFWLRVDWLFEEAPSAAAALSEVVGGSFAPGN